MQARADKLGVSTEAIQLALGCEVVDLHIDTFIPVRLFGYDPFKRHEPGLLMGRHFGHLDLPRMQDAGVSAGLWSITTNPCRSKAGRWSTLLKNLEDFQTLVRGSEGQMEVASTYSEYMEVRSRKAHACLISVQGGNCFGGAERGPEDIPGKLITRVTLIHLTNSHLGTSSTPLSWLRRNRGLSQQGCELVHRLDSERIFVDLAHIHPDGFWDAVREHDASLPLIDTHTGVSGVTPHWRNLDDRQLKAIADTGGVIGIIYSAFFLKGAHGHKDGQMIIEHMQHVIDVVGEDFVAVGSDYDGAILPPPDFRSGDSYPKLVQLMLDRGWSPERIEKILGKNFLRSFQQLRP